MQPTNEDLLNGAIYITHKHRSDIETVLIWVGFVVLVTVGAWLGVHTFNLLFPAPHPVQVCQTVAQCNRYILAHPIRVAHPVIPVYKPGE